MLDPTSISIVVADELTLVGDGLSALCDSFDTCRVVGKCNDGLTAWQMVESLVPDVVVLDLNLPELSSLELVRKIAANQLPTRSLILTQRQDRSTVVDILRSGASGLLLKSAPGRQLREAIEYILTGGVYVSSEVQLEQVFSAKSRSGPEPLDLLSARERQVFTLLVDGVRAKQIANHLELSPKTIDTYRASLMRKLNIHDVAGLVKFAVERHLLG